MKARIRNLLDEIWLLVQPIHKSKRILHVWLYYRNGQRRYVCASPPGFAVRPWPCADLDVRAGEIPDVTANPLAVP